MPKDAAERARIVRLVPKRHKDSPELRWIDGCELAKREDVTLARLVEVVGAWERAGFKGDETCTHWDAIADMAVDYVRSLRAKEKKP